MEGCLVVIGQPGSEGSQGADDPILSAEEQIDPDRWEILTGRIEDGDCTPIIGAGASRDFIPAGSELACTWATECKYPLRDRHDLARVAQYRAIHIDPSAPGEWIKGKFKEYLGELGEDYVAPSSDDPHRVLGGLPLPVYITTNYDDLMARALRGWQKTPHEVSCQWRTKHAQDHPPVRSEALQPSEKAPVVFHLHGRYSEPRSMVVSENDYLDFLVHMSIDGEGGQGTGADKLLPTKVREALASRALIFIGYSFSDWNFRLLMRSIVESGGGQKRSVAVQIPGEDVPVARRAKAQDYLGRYFKKVTSLGEMDVFWGTAQQFVRRLSDDLGVENKAADLNIDKAE